MTKIMKGGLSYCATSNMVALTQAQYDALSTAQKNNGNFYFITDANPSYFSAANIDYDNTDSGLSATDVQSAIDEVNTKVNGLHLTKTFLGQHIGAASTYTDFNISVTSYDALLIELQFWGTPFADLFLFAPFSATAIRTSGYVDSTNFFASGQMQLNSTYDKMTRLYITATFNASGVGIAAYGINFIVQ